MDAPEKLGWDLTFDVIGDGIRDALSGLKNLVTGLAATREKLSESDKAAGRFIDTMGRMREANGRFVEGLGSANAGLSKLTVTLGDVIGVAKTAYDVLTSGARALDAYGDKAIKAFGERGSAIRAYTTLLGDAKQAELEFYKAQQLAARTDLTAEATQKAQQQLLVAGFRGQDKDATLLAGLDLASISPGDKNEALKSFARATAQIKQKGKLQQEELLQLAEGASLGTGFVKSELVKILGVKDTDAVDKKQKKGEITADQGLLAIQRAVLAQLGTQKLGEYATGSSGTLTGLLSNKGEAFDNILKGIDSELLPAVKRYKESLVASTDVLNVETRDGANLSIVLQDLANTSLEVKSAQETFTTSFLKEFGSSYTQGLRELGLSELELKNGFEELRGVAKELGSAMGGLGELIAKISHPAKALGIEDAVFEARAFLYGEKNDEGNYVTRLTAKQAARQDEDFATRKALADAANGKGEVQGTTTGGGGAAANPYGSVALKNFGGYRLKGEKAASKSKGGGKGGGGGGLSTYGGYDYGPLTLEGGGGGAAMLPSASIGALQSQAEAALLPTIQAAASVKSGDTIVEQVDIHIDGSDLSKGDIAEAVVDVLRNIGRFARNPAPKRD